MSAVFALVVAAGRGTRFGGAVPKQYLPLGAGTVLRHAVAAFARHERVDGVQVVIRDEDRAIFDAATAGLSLLPPVPGGAERQDSVRLGLEALVPHDPSRVLIHDGARPFPDAGLIDRVLDALDRSPAAIPALPLGDTIKRVENGVIRETVDRAHLWRAQTPQGFHFPSILAAHRAAAGRVLTDDAAVAEAAGLAPLVVAGSEDNLKVTTAQDLAAAERLLASRLADVRVGQGFDVHGFAPGDHVMICGIEIPHEHSLAGHSDADVGLHALTDALLGAIGAGDIGMHFPPSDPRWRGAPLAPVSASCGRPRPRPRRQHRRGGRDRDLRAPENRPASLADDRTGCRNPRHPSRSGQRQGDDDRTARLHRARRRHRGAGDRDRAAAAVARRAA